MRYTIASRRAGGAEGSGRVARTVVPLALVDSIEVIPERPDTVLAVSLRTAGETAFAQTIARNVGTLGEPVPADERREIATTWDYVWAGDAERAEVVARALRGAVEACGGPRRPEAPPASPAP
jgi:hypothetical protein